MEYRGRNNQFSHFFPCSIIINGINFVSAEQAYQYFKAKCNHDFDLCAKIMMESDPVKIKRLGSGASVPPHRWDLVKEIVMMCIDYVKYHQNPQLAQALLATHPLPLIENVPDAFWGVGHDGNGANKAGKILVIIRSCLKYGTAPFPSALIVGDSMLRHVVVPNCRVIFIPGAGGELVSTVASLFPPNIVKNVILFSGTNDLVMRDGSTTQPNLIARRMLNAGVDLARNNPGRKVVISTILDRCEPSTHKKIAKYQKDLIKYKIEENVPNVFIFKSKDCFDLGSLRDGLHLHADASRQLGKLFTEILGFCDGQMPKPSFIE